jgi:hypothetical protein
MMKRLQDFRLIHIYKGAGEVYQSLPIFGNNVGEILLPLAAFGRKTPLN